ncbi:FecCD family ABC transporter permease [Catenovulum agarivorans]|uniref:FecCD family ABC transporter permease n=1 Tax=Catenovulum agarivorans TaxID=1172192 RepID=UPI00030D089A|nr:iron ABC transporter permease [Catenovulum agarivorans]
MNNYNTHAKIGLKFAFGALLLIASFFTVILMGAADLTFTDVYSCLFATCVDPLTQTLVWQIRLPRVIIGALCGAGLAVAGAVLQNTTRNPLAEPYLFGVVSGAGLGATIVSVVFKEASASYLPIAAFLGAILAIVIVMAVSVAGKHTRKIESLLLAGVAVSFMLSALSQFILYMGDPFAANRVMFWLMGSLARVEMPHLYWIVPVLLIGLAIVVLLHRQLDAILLGDESAATLGINVTLVRVILLMVCAAITATIVAYCGGIGFVGLMIPHIVRRLFASTSLILVCGSALVGAIFMLWVDVLARTAVDGQEIPIGVITSIIGSLFFLTLMHKKV